MLGAAVVEERRTLAAAATAVLGKLLRVGGTMAEVGRIFFTMGEAAGEAEAEAALLELDEAPGPTGATVAPSDVFAFGAAAAAAALPLLLLRAVDAPPLPYPGRLPTAVVVVAASATPGGFRRLPPPSFGVAGVDIAE